MLERLEERDQRLKHILTETTDSNNVNQEIAFEIHLCAF